MIVVLNGSNGERLSVLTIFTWNVPKMERKSDFSMQSGGWNTTELGISVESSPSERPPTLPQV